MYLVREKTLGALRPKWMKLWRSLLWLWPSINLKSFLSSVREKTKKPIISSLLMASFAVIGIYST